MQTIESRLSALVILCALLGGCSTTDRDMKSYMGHPIAEVVAQWGAPSRSAENPPGWVYTWEYQRTVIMPTYLRTNYVAQPGIYNGGYYQTTGMPGGAASYVATRTFWTNAEGVIYNYSWQGE